MPVDPKTGKEYPYTEEGIAEHKKDTGGMPMKQSAFKMKGSAFYGHGNSSPAKQDVDTGFADRVYSKARVDEGLTKSGHHTEGSLRGKKKSKHHDTGKGSFLGTGGMS